MSKKRKGQPALVPAGSPIKLQPATPRSQPAPTPEPTDASSTERSFELIRFDRRVRLTLIGFAALFLLFVLFKWHYVSLPIWNTILPDGSATTRGLVTGTPKQIRMDDYAVGTPWILSSINNDFMQQNEGIGGLNASLLLAPTHHIVTVFRPGHWGFLFMDSERGFAWMYDTNPFVLLVGAFLFFLLITSNQYWLSLLGTITLLFSSGTVRWAFIPTAPVAYCCAAFVAFVYLLHERKPINIVLYALLLVWTVCTFVLILYPPYQLPLVYLFVFVLVGYVLNNRRALFPPPSIPIKALALAGAVGLAGLVLSFFYADVHETLTAVTKTVYPGQRSETGGTGFVANWHSEYYSWLFDDQKIPPGWLNICELSHYLNFAPVIIPASVALFVLNRRIDWMLAAAALFVGLMWIWMEVGFPAGLAKASLMSMVPTRRAQIPMGVGGILLLIIYLSTIRTTVIRVPVWANALAVAGIIGFMAYTAYININDTNGFIKPYQTYMPVIFFSLMNSLLLFTIPIRHRTALFGMGLLIFLLPNLKANPLAKGLTPITDNTFYKTVRQMVIQDPQARWLVNGSQYITYMVTATGAKQVTGVKYLPDRKRIFKVLDPAMKRDSAYNRYAHVTNQSYIDGRDSVVLVNQFEDAYVIAMDPCSPRMKQMNVKYQVFDHQPQPAEVRCMKLIATLGSLTIYQANP